MRQEKSVLDSWPLGQPLLAEGDIGGEGFVLTDVSPHFLAHGVLSAAPLTLYHI